MAGRFEQAVEGARRAGVFEPENFLFYTPWVVLMLSGREDEAALMTRMVDRKEDPTFTRLLRFHIAAVSPVTALGGTRPHPGLVAYSCVDPEDAGCYPFALLRLGPPGPP